MRAVLFDLRSAARSLASSRGFTATAVATLGAGLALCIAVMAVLNAYVVRALPYPAADRLYRLDYGVPGGTQADFRQLVALDWPALDDVFEHAIAWDLDVFYLLGTGSAERGASAYPESAPGAWVTPGYVEGLGVRAAIGRAFTARDFEPDAPSVAVISARLWRQRYGADPAVVGRTFNAYVSDRPDDPETFTIVGVLPGDAWHFNTYTEVFAPLRGASYPYLARLREGVSPDAVADRLTGFVRAGVGPLPDDWRVVVTSLQRHYTAAVRPMIGAVGAAAALVLLIAGANVAVLLLLRGARRRKDLAVRAALGAGRARLARLLVFEGLLLGLGATIVGLAASRSVLRSFGSSIQTFVDRRVPGGPEAFALDGTVLLWSAACGLAVTLVFTVVPLVSVWSARLSPLFTSGRGSTETPGSRRARSVLIGFEVAASLALLVGASLMVASGLRMLEVDFGLDASRVSSASLSLRQRSYPDAGSQAVFFDRLTARLEAMPIGRSVAIANWWLMQDPPTRPIAAADRGDTPVDAGVFSVTSQYFDVLGVPLRDGRAFDARDRADGEPVAIVSDSLARRLWPDGPAVGRFVTVGTDEETATSVARRVVGVAGDVRQSHQDDLLFDAYVPFVQEPGRFASVYVRDPRSPAWVGEVRTGVGGIDPEVAVGGERLLAAGLEQERVRPAFLAALLAVFAAAAAMLALVGMHGVIAYAVRQRQREVAIRLAMGADAAAVTRLFMRQGAAVLIIGIAAGLWGAITLGRLLDTYLYGVAPVEPRVLVGASLAFGVAGLVAIWRPSARASKVDPARVLNAD